MRERFERTHRGSKKIPGMTITYALQERYENCCESSKNEKHPKARLLLETKVTNLILADGNTEKYVCEDKKNKFARIKKNKFARKKDPLFSLRKVFFF